MSHTETGPSMIIQLRRNLKRTLLLPLAQSRSVLKSDQVAQDFVQSGLQNSQGWRLHHLPEAPVLVPDYLNEEKCFYIQGRCLFFKLIVTISCLPGMHHCDEITPFCPLQGVLLLLGSLKFSSSPGWTRCTPPPA